MAVNIEQGVYLNEVVDLVDSQLAQRHGVTYPDFDRFTNHKLAAQNYRHPSSIGEPVSNHSHH